MASLTLFSSVNMKASVRLRERSTRMPKILKEVPQRRKLISSTAAQATSTGALKSEGKQNGSGVGSSDGAKKVALGVDVGGSGIKGALVDLTTGQLITERHRIPTPECGSPAMVSQTVGELARHFNWTGPIGCGFPAAVRPCGEVLTAANICNEWIGQNAVELFSEATGSEHVSVFNDADAAGSAEMAFGAGKGVKGLVVMLTLGTGIGTALFQDGHLVPNTELGHLLLPSGVSYENFASDAARSRSGLKTKQWAKERVSPVLISLEDYLWPDLIIIGGGISKKHEKWFPSLKGVKTKVVPAEMLNEAGIVGAAVHMLSFEDLYQ